VAGVRDFGKRGALWRRRCLSPSRPCDLVEADGQRQFVFREDALS
jgi:hypothetical protein